MDRRRTAALYSEFEDAPYLKNLNLLIQSVIQNFWVAVLKLVADTLGVHVKVVQGKIPLRPIRPLAFGRPTGDDIRSNLGNNVLSNISGCILPPLMRPHASHLHLRFQ